LFRIEAAYFYSQSVPMLNTNTMRVACSLSRQRTQHFCLHSVTLFSWMSPFSIEVQR